jgi:CyaY protein
MLDEARYDLLAAQVFRRLLEALDQLDPDLLDAESTGEMLTLTSDTGERCVVNTQRAARQIWVAGRGEGIHFSFDEPSGQWRDDKGRGLELYAFVAQVVRELTGSELAL